MYIPPIFKNENVADVLDFVRHNGFGILISQTEGRSVATHIPMELAENELGEAVLVGHISRGNPQWKNFVADTEVLAIFNGPHSYVSSSWYTHENVPTWNYIAVHIYGKIKIVTGEKLLLSLQKLVDKYEKQSAQPVSLSTISPQLINREIKGIVGFEIAISDIQAAHKLSQNRNTHDHANIVAELRKTNDPAAQQVADAMEQQKK